MSLKLESVNYVVGERIERRSKMGTCNCGQPTVWNDMCQDCNNAFDDRIYERYSDVPKDYTWSHVDTEETSDSFFSSDILNIHISLKKVVGISSLDMTGSYFDIVLESGGKTRIETRRDIHDYNTIMNEQQRMIDSLKSVYT